MKINWLFVKISVLIVTLILLLSFSYNRYEDRELNKLNIEIDYSSGNRFVSDKVVNNLLKKTHPDFPEMEMKRVDVAEMEKTLNDYPFVKTAQVFMDNTGELSTQIKQEIPVVRVHQATTDYYITHEGKQIPTSPNHSATVLLASGKMDSTNFSGLSNLAIIINEDKLLKNLIVGVHKENVNSFILFVDNTAYSIELGDLKNLKEKFEHFKLFYEQYLSKTENQPYHQISLKFKNQIVGKK